MRAAVLHEVDGGLSVEEVTRQGPGPTEVGLRVRACGVCHTDLHVIKGEVAFPLPCVLGHEVSGTVVEVGRDVRHVVVGDEVVCSFIMPCGTCRHCARGHSDLCEVFFGFNRLRGVLYDGTSRLSGHDGTPLAMYSMAGFATEVVAPASAVFAVEAEMDLEAAAILGCSVLTAYGAVVNVAALRPGEDVAVVAAGGVGLNIIALARAFGAGRIIAIDVADDKLDKARQLGASHTVNSTRDVAAAVAQITSGRGTDVAFEALGRPVTFETALGCVGDGGRAVMVGIAPQGQVASVDITRLVRRKIQLLGSYGGRPAADMPAVLRLVERGVVDPRALISRTYPLDDVATAFADLDRGAIVGRALVLP